MGSSFLITSYTKITHALAYIKKNHYLCSRFKLGVKCLITYQNDWKGPSRY